GIDFTHRSNGGVVQPDRGVSVLGPKIAVRYDFGRDGSNHPIPTRPPPVFHPTWDLVVGGAGGLKNVLEQSSPILREDFGVFSATGAVQRHFYQFGKLAGGLDLTYDGATGAKGHLANGALVRWRADAAERWSAGLYGGYEHVIGRGGVFVHLGYNVARGFEDDASPPRLYQRFGWRYHFNDRLWGTVAIRSVKGHKAGFLQVGAGDRIPLAPDRPTASPQ